MRKTLYFGLFWLSLLTSSAFSSQDWSEKQEKDGIKIQTRKLQNQKYREIRAETVIESSITNVFDFISDPNSCKKWVYRCSLSEALSLNDRNEKVIYQLTKFPFPLKSREVFLSTKTTKTKLVLNVSFPILLIKSLSSKTFLVLIPNLMQSNPK